MAQETMQKGSAVEFKQDRVYSYSYPTNKRATVPRHHDNRFWFVQAVLGAGVTHYLFKSVTGGYTISFTERDFRSGDAQML